MINYKDLQDFDYVIFDIFDILLFKKVNPEYVKKIWCNHVIKYFDLKINMIDLYQYRCSCESNLINNNLKNDFDVCFKYDDLINHIFSHFVLDNYEIDFDCFLDSCFQIEVDIFKSVIEIDSDIISIIKRLKKNNKKIYFICNSYLSKKMLNYILKDFDIDLFDDIVFCELFNYDVFKDLGISFNKCVIVSDKVYDNDFLNGLEINTFYLDNNKEFCLDNLKSFDDINKEFKYLFGLPTDNFEHIVFSLYTFIERLYYELLKKGKSEVIFLSREGEFLKKLFDVYVLKIHNKKIVSKYMIVSRKATYLPSLKSIQEEDFSSLLSQYSCISVYDFLKSLNFDEQEIGLIKDSFSFDVFDFYEKVSCFEKSEIFNKLVKNNKFIKIYESKRCLQNKNFKKYVKQITDSMEISVVDVGWNGSIQDNISNILGDSYSVNGYYLGLEKRDNSFDINKKGLVFSNVPYFSRDYKLYNVNRAIYEILLGASHGSANSYVLDNGEINVQLFSKKEETELYNNVISKIQDSMLNSFSLLCDIFVNGFYDNIKYQKLFNKVYFNMMFNPSRKQIDFFNNIYHYENFGVFEFTTFKSNKSFSKFKEYIDFFSKFSYYFNDTLWPMLKLCNNDMKIAGILYRNLKRVQFIKSNIL